VNGTADAHQVPGHVPATRDAAEQPH